MDVAVLRILDHEGRLAALPGRRSRRRASSDGVTAFQPAESPTDGKSRASSPASARACSARSRAARAGISSASVQRRGRSARARARASPKSGRDTARLSYRTGFALP